MGWNMNTNFDAVAYLSEERWMQSRLGLERISELLYRLGNPEDKLRIIHVAGTNGKGSLCSFMAQILRAAGYRVGLFMSPSTISFADRISIDGEIISTEDLSAITLEVKEAADAMEDHPTEFELMTAVAFRYFEYQALDVVVCEVGLGGRLDSTNVIKHPELSIICSISLEHRAILGNTLEEIAIEKAGIIKEGVAVVSWPQHDDAMKVIERVACDREASLRVADFSQLKINPNEDKSYLDGGNLRQSFDYKGYKQLELSLLASCQPYNAACAIEALEVLRKKGWDISDDALREGLVSTVLPGRFEFVRTGDSLPLFIIDGAHNPESVLCLIDSLKRYFAQAKPVFILGFLKDKDYHEMLEYFVSYGSVFVTISPPSPRALSAEDLTDSIHRAKERVKPGDGSLIVSTSNTIIDAVEHAIELAGAEGLVCACGSISSVAALKEALAAYE